MRSAILDRHILSLSIFYESFYSHFHTRFIPLHFARNPSSLKQCVNDGIQHNFRTVILHSLYFFSIFAWRTAIEFTKSFAKIAGTEKSNGIADFKNGHIRVSQ